MKMHLKTREGPTASVDENEVVMGEDERLASRIAMANFSRLQLRSIRDVERDKSLSELVSQILALPKDRRRGSPLYCGITSVDERRAVYTYLRYKESMDDLLTILKGDTGEHYRRELESSLGFGDGV